MKSLKIYQFHIWLKDISPKIYRRILVRSDSSIHDFHYTIQVAFDWSDDRTHCFKIHGKEYGMSRDGGMCFCDDPRKVMLEQFEFRINENFTYIYDFFDYWEHFIRLEKVLPFDDKQYPRCIDANELAPPETCGGPPRFYKLKTHYSEAYMYCRSLEVLGILAGITKPEPEENDYNVDRESLIHELKVLDYWQKRSKVNRREINTLLKKGSTEGNLAKMVTSFHEREFLY